MLIDFVCIGVRYNSFSCFKSMIVLGKDFFFIDDVESGVWLIFILF